MDQRAIHGQKRPVAGGPPVLLGDVVAELDLGCIDTACHAGDPHGTLPIGQQMMISRSLHGNGRRARGSHRYRPATWEDVGFRVL